MALIEIWVPIIKKVQPLSPTGYSYHPNIPAGVAHSSDCLECDRASPVPRPFVQTFYILVDETDVSKCTHRIDVKDVPERDKRFRDMLRHCRGDMTKAQAFFAALTLKNATAQRKRDAKDVLIQAVARGYDPAQADATTKALALPSTSKIGGIDAELHGAAVICITRNTKRTTAEAEAFIREHVARGATGGVVR